MKRTHPFLAASAFLALLVPHANAQAQISSELTPSGIRILIDGALFTEYHGTGAQRPYMYPIIGPSGANLARPFPMEEGGAKDHKHHRSLWFTHGAVNGIDFWADGEQHGQQIHGKVSDVKVEGSAVTFNTTTDWVSAQGKKILADTRTIKVEALPNGGRSIDFSVTLKATEGDVVFGDTKEGSFALRVGPTLSVENKGAEEEAQGSIVASTGEENAKAWGVQAPWVTFYGPDAKGARVAITIFDHPANPRHPTWWHARTYGLFAANPFGKHDFEKLEDKTAGDLKVPAGESITFTWRVLFEAGDPVQDHLKGVFEAFSKTTP